MSRLTSLTVASLTAGLVFLCQSDSGAATRQGSFRQPKPLSVITSPLLGNTKTKTVMIAGDIAQALTPQVVYTVPSGFTLSLTDIAIVNYNSAICDVVFGNGPDYVTSEIRAQPNAMAALSLHTGLYVAAGASVYMVTDERLPGDGGCTPTFTLIGTLTKKG